jgi:hypothetical protein
MASVDVVECRRKILFILSFTHSYILTVFQITTRNEADTFRWKKNARKTIRNFS